MSLRNIRLVLSYDGTNFCGWQEQTKGRSVQAVIQDALAAHHRHPVHVGGAGRTDAGVHATGQCANFVTDIDSIPGDRFATVLNSILPADVRVSESAEVPAEFHARYDARMRMYKYYVTVGRSSPPCSRLYAHRVSIAPNIDRLNRDAACLIGEHDFATFASAADGNGSTVRTVYSASFSVRRAMIVFSIAADGFLWKMVRSIVGSLLANGPNRVPLRDALEARDRSASGTTAPPHGLFLHKVCYDVEHEFSRSAFSSRHA